MMTESITEPSHYQTMRQRTQQQRHHFNTNSDDADVAAGGAQQPSNHSTFHPPASSSSAPSSPASPSASMSTSVSVPVAVPVLVAVPLGSEVPMDPLVKAPSPTSPLMVHASTTAVTAATNVSSLSPCARKVIVFGCDISHLPRKYQFLISACGVFFFSLLYGYLQELISVTLCSRQLGLFLAMVQFMGYALWSRFFKSHVQKKHGRSLSIYKQKQYESSNTNIMARDVPIQYYILLSLLRAIDASMTNMAMAYVNYPAKTLMKSSRVVFTMLFSTIVSRKRYKLMDYLVVLLMVSGLAIFMHADSQSSAVFQPLGIVMLTTSLCCDAVINNMSERIMNQYHVGQDEFIYKLYSIALVGIVGAAAFRGDLWEGTRYLLTPGTYQEILDGTTPSWSIHGKIVAIVLFASTGFLGSSCSALITKEFGALTMSITSTARKATTLFLSFALFNNVCTVEHVGGIVLFITALIGKSIRASRKGHGGHAGNHHGYTDQHQQPQKQQQPLTLDMETSPLLVNGYYGTNTKKHSSSSVKRRPTGGGRTFKNLGDIV